MTDETFTNAHDHQWTEENIGLSGDGSVANSRSLMTRQCDICGTSEFKARLTTPKELIILNRLRDSLLGFINTNTQ